MDLQIFENSQTPQNEKFKLYFNHELKKARFNFVISFYIIHQIFIEIF